MGTSKKDPGVLLRIPQELYERVMAWSSETGKTTQEILLDAVKRALVSWPDGLDSESLRAENERLKKQLQETNERLLSFYPPERPPVTPIEPRRVSKEEQKRALQEAQKKLAAIRTQREKEKKPIQAPTVKSAEIQRLKDVEQQVEQVATELLSPRAEMLYQKRIAARRGRIDGIAYEENDVIDRRITKEETTKKPPHVKPALQQKAAEIATNYKQVQNPKPVLKK